MNHQIKRSQVISIIGFYLIGVLLFSVYTYFDTQQKLTNIVDKKLLVAAHAANDLLGSDFHVNLENENSIWYELDYQIALKLNDFVKKVDIAYAYTMIQDDTSAIRFVTSSPTDDELNNDNYQKTYYSLYLEADKTIYQSFATSEIHYAEYKDRWGSFRSIFIPMVSTDGTQYVVGADVKIDEVKAIAYKSALRAFIICTFLGFIALPLIYNYIKSIHREMRMELRRRFRDPLTSLSNRNSLIESLSEANNPSLAIININGFGEITNIYGSDEGDNVLLQLKDRLLSYKERCSKQIEVFRLHSDEFAVYADDVVTDADFFTVLENLREYIEAKKYLVNEKEIILNITIGAVTQHKKALIFADMALREAKDKHESIVVYESELLLPERYKKNLKHAQILKEAIQKDHLIPYFQPIKNIQTNQIEKYEVLARVVDSQGNIVLMPEDFIAVAARTRQYSKVTKTMLSKSIEVLKKTPDSDFKVSINIAISDIEDPATRNYIVDMVQSSSLSHRIEFELLESEKIKHIKSVVQFIQQLKQYGVKFGIDDLGKEYSNFDRLIKLPVDFLKIDGSIMANILNSDDAFVMARKIVEIAQHKKIKTVAEYCCSIEIEDKAKSLHVDYVQGFYIGKPEKAVGNTISHAAIA